VIALNERQFKATLLGAFILLSWAVLWAWSQTHYGQHSHQPVASILPVLYFAAGWTLMTVAMMHTPGAHEPTHAAFWFIMSMALLVGAVVAYPMNAWLVSNHLKHGMTTVRPPGSPFAEASDVPMAAGAVDHAAMGHGSMSSESMAPAAMGSGPMNHAAMTMGSSVSRGRIAAMTILSFVVFAAGLVIDALFGGLR